MRSVGIQSWKNAPLTESEYERLVELLDDSIDRVGEVESHPLALMMDVLSALIENDEKNVNVSELALK